MMKDFKFERHERSDMWHIKRVSIRHSRSRISRSSCYVPTSATLSADFSPNILTRVARDQRENLRVTFSICIWTKNLTTHADGSGGNAIGRVPRITVREILRTRLACYQVLVVIVTLYKARYYDITRSSIGTKLILDYVQLNQNRFLGTS